MPIFVHINRRYYNKDYAVVIITFEPACNLFVCGFFCFQNGEEIEIIWLLMLYEIDLVLPNILDIPGIL